MGIKHGDSFSGNATTEYKTWAGIKRRCYNKNEISYPHYGGRGITVCERWRNDFSAFLSDMGRKPSPRHSIDRIDVNGHYAPGNCRWVSAKEQANNKRNNSYLEIEGFTATIKEWSEVVGIDSNLVYTRISNGMDPVSALSSPVIHRGKNRVVCGNGHPWDESTAYVRPDTGHRMCITCIRNNTQRNASRAIELQRQRRALNKARGEAVGIQRGGS